MDVCDSTFGIQGISTQASVLSPVSRGGVSCAQLAFSVPSHRCECFRAGPHSTVRYPEWLKRFDAGLCVTTHHPWQPSPCAGAPSRGSSLPVAEAHCSGEAAQTFRPRSCLRGQELRGTSTSDGQVRLFGSPWPENSHLTLHSGSDLPPTHP